MKTFLFLITLFFVQNLFASIDPDPVTGNGTVTNGPNTPPPGCVSSTPAGNTCSSSTTICDINGYCGNTSSAYTVDTWSGLDNAFSGSIENNSFINFVAGGTTVTFNLWVYNCRDGNGIQVMVFSSNNCAGAVTNHLTWNPGSAPNRAQLFTINGLVAGRTYSIMIDGYANDICDYTITTNSNSNILTPPVISASSNTICLGEPITLTATGGDGVYNWNVGNGINAGTTGPTVTFTPPTSGVHTYTTQSSQGNVNCLQQGAGSTVVNVDNCPCVATVSSSRTEFCANGTETFNLEASLDVVGTISWTGPNGFTASGASVNDVLQPTTSGIYEYIATGTTTNGTCNQTITITVNELPSAVITAPQITCSVPSPTLTITTTNTQSIEWSKNTNVLGTSSTLTVQEGGDYTLKLTSDKQCVNTITQTVVIDTIRPVVNTNTPAVITCLQPNVNIVATSSVTGAVYTWTGPNIIGPTTTASINVGRSGTYIYTVKNPVNDCQTQGSVIVTDNLTPPTITAVNKVNIDCRRDEIDFNLELTPLNSSVVWQGPNGIVVNQNDIVIQTQGVYTATVTNPINGCTSTHSLIVASDFRAPNANFSTLETLKCVPYQNKFIAEQDSANFDYDWIIDDVHQYNSVAKLPYTMEKIGCSEVKLIVTNQINGCISTVTQTDMLCGLEQVVAKINATPTYLMTYDVPLVNLSNIGSHYTDQQWLLPNHNQQSTNTVKYDFSSHNEGQWFTLIVNNSNVCFDTAKVFIPLYEDVLVYVPNTFTPNGDLYNNTFKITVVGAYDVLTFNMYVYNRWGEMVWENHDPHAEWDGMYNGKPVPDGSYKWQMNFKKALNDEIIVYTGGINILR